MQELKNAGNKSNRELTFTDSYRAFCNDSYCLRCSPGPRAINNVLIYCRLFRSWSNGAGRFNKCEIGSGCAITCGKKQEKKCPRDQLNARTPTRPLRSILSAGAEPNWSDIRAATL